MSRALLIFLHLQKKTHNVVEVGWRIEVHRPRSLRSTAQEQISTHMQVVPHKIIAGSEALKQAGWGGVVSGGGTKQDRKKGTTLS